MLSASFPDEKRTSFSLLLKGESGSGKTHSIGVLAAAGYKVLLADVEGRAEAIKRHRPLIVPIKSKAELDELLKILFNPTERKKFVSTATKGEWQDIDLFAMDSLMEYEQLLDAELRKKYPSKGDGAAYSRWDEYGIELLSVCSRLRDIASDKNPEPIPVIITMGEAFLTTKAGTERAVPLVKGNIAPARLPFYFSAVFRLDAGVEEGSSGKASFTMITVGNGVKSVSPDLFPPLFKVNPDTFLKVWKTLETFYREGESAAKTFLQKKG